MNILLSLLFILSVVSANEISIISCDAPTVTQGSGTMKFDYYSDVNCMTAAADIAATFAATSFYAANSTVSETVYVSGTSSGCVTALSSGVFPTGIVATQVEFKEIIGQNSNVGTTVDIGFYSQAGCLQSSSVALFLYSSQVPTATPQCVPFLSGPGVTGVMSVKLSYSGVSSVIFCNIALISAVVITAASVVMTRIL